MRDLRDRAAWLPISEQKPIPPYTLDPTLTFYCPQENVEALYHPDVRALHAHMRDEYTPPSVAGRWGGPVVPRPQAKAVFDEQGAPGDQPIPARARLQADRPAGLP